ncbi:MAG: 6-phosphofructokinase, partial [Thermodesulfobacteriota bacterium]
DVILIPEIPFNIETICRKITENELHGKHYAIIVVAEGASAESMGVIHKNQEKCESGRQEALLGGIGEWVANQIRECAGKDTRSMVLGHLQRGGSPTTFDRLLALRFGAAAVRMAENGQFNQMVSLVNGEMAAVPLVDAIKQRKKVPIDSDKVLTAREIGICFGDEY